MEGPEPPPGDGGVEVTTPLVGEPLDETNGAHQASAQEQLPRHCEAAHGNCSAPTDTVAGAPQGIARDMMPIAAIGEDAMNRAVRGDTEGDGSILGEWYESPKRLQAVDIRVVTPFLSAVVEGRDEAWLSTDWFESHMTLFTFMKRLWGLRFMGPKGDNEKSFWHSLLLSIHAQREQLG